MSANIKLNTVLTEPLVSGYQTAQHQAHDPKLFRPQSHKYTSCSIDIYSTRLVLKVVSMNSRKQTMAAITQAC